MPNATRAFLTGAADLLLGVCVGSAIAIARLAWHRRRARDNPATQKLARKAHTDHTRRFGAAEKVTR